MSEEKKSLKVHAVLINFDIEENLTINRVVCIKISASKNFMCKNTF